MVTATTPRKPRARKGEEIWQCKVVGKYWLSLSDKRGRVDSRPFAHNDRLTITTDDRQLIQSQATKDDEDPFLNGTFLRVDKDQQMDQETKSEQALTDEQLMDFVSGEVDPEKLNGLNDINIRRLKVLASQADLPASKWNNFRGYMRDRFNTMPEPPKQYTEDMAGA